MLAAPPVFVERLSHVLAAPAVTLHCLSLAVVVALGSVVAAVPVPLLGRFLLLQTSASGVVECVGLSSHGPLAAAVLPVLAAAAAVPAAFLVDDP